MEYYADISPMLMVSDMAEKLVGSEIIKIATEIKKKKAAGEKIYNYTIGDFDPKLFPIPDFLKEEIIKAYQDNLTNYPSANGEEILRKAISRLLHTRLGLEYNESQVLVSGGSRPLIYATYQTVLDPGDNVVFPVPSWNNNHYAHLAHANAIFLETSYENNFMPSALDLKPHIANTKLISLCSPLNPTGTSFKKEQLEEICELILEENSKRPDTEKPVYLLFDQVYWLLNFGQNMHFDPVNLFPEMKNYTIYIDGISKSFCATGVRVGWATGPTKLIDKMRSILSHIGAWAPKPEQLATAKFLQEDQKVSTFLDETKEKIFERLSALHDGFTKLKEAGFPVDVIKPEASIYLTVKIDICGATYADNVELKNSMDVAKYLLNEAGIAIVPFFAFGASQSSPWYRISIGQCQMEDIEPFFEALEKALSSIKNTP